MRYQIVTNTDGAVIGTYILDLPKQAGGPDSVEIIPSAAQISHKVDVPDEIHKIRSKNVDEFHKALENHLKAIKA